MRSKTFKKVFDIDIARPRRKCRGVDIYIHLYKNLTIRRKCAIVITVEEQASMIQQQYVSFNLTEDKRITCALDDFLRLFKMCSGCNAVIDICDDICDKCCLEATGREGEVISNGMES